MSYSNINSLKDIINKNIFFFDLETTGLVKTKKGFKPEEEYYNYKDFTIYDSSRIVSIGWIYWELFDFYYYYNIDMINEHIIKPNNFIIPDDSIKIHGITNEIANANGKKINIVLKKIGEYINECDYIIGYNIYFDINILLSELYRENQNETILKILKLKEEKKIICIGQISAKEAKPNGWKQYSNYRIPKMVDVYKKCFNKEIINAHNSKSDVFAMIKILYWIYSYYYKYKNKNKMSVKPIFNGKQADDYDENGFNYADSDSDNEDFSMCGYGKPISIIEYYECINCYKQYIITSSAGRDAIDGDYDNSTGDKYNCNDCGRIIHRYGQIYDNDDIMFDEKIYYDEIIVKKNIDNDIKIIENSEKIKLNILSYNLFYGESLKQIEFINEMNYDILFLSEASKDVLINFENYRGTISNSHCYNLYLGINNKYKIEVIEEYTFRGIILLHVKIDNKEVILGSIHLEPGPNSQNKRFEQLELIIEVIKEMNSNKVPIIIGGDTNMINNINMVWFDLYDVYLYESNSKYKVTYPNKNFNDERIIYKTKNEYRYDRFFIKNCKYISFKTIENNDSDHLAITTTVEL
jgi:hypothetical protein